MNGIPVVPLYDTPLSGINRLLKRAEDIVLASLILLLISPVLCGIALLVKLTSKGPVIFRQTRYGMDGKPIKVWKFRSMKVMENDAVVTQATQNDPRVTLWGISCVGRRWMNCRSLLTCSPGDVYRRTTSACGGA
jgi:putative colanic acid biosynthesis UDP-glucose lipid carrier transferase